MSPTAARVLVIGANPNEGKRRGGLLPLADCAVLRAHNLADALVLAREKPVDLVLLDLGRSGADGFECLRQLKESSEFQGVPVIALTVGDDLRERLRAFELGAADCLARPFAPEELQARIRARVHAKRGQDNLAQVNRKLNTARVQAEAAARTKGEFLATVSHEIRNPLNGVVAMLDLLRETALTPDQRGYVETISASSDTLLNILNDLLDFSRIESGKLELESRPLHLRAVLEEALDLQAASASRKPLDLAYQMDDAIPEVVLGDATRLRQVLVNLLANAMKFTERGEVEVQVKSLHPPKRGKVGPLWHLHFSVRDTGIGISADHLEKLFQPFTQAETAIARQYGGTGLGLAISKRLVELMGGKMWAESVPGQGSTFHFTLSLPAAPSTSSAVGLGQPTLLGGRRLLIVDDNQMSRRILASQAAKWGLVALAAQTAQEALARLRAGEKFDVAILDRQMPGVDGVQLAAEIRKLPACAGLPLVLLNSMGAKTEGPQLAAIGFASCLTKPVKPCQLFEVLVRALSHSPAATETKTTPGPREALLATRLPLRVLVCDDNIVSQKVAIRLLHQLGYRPDLADNGVQVLARLDAQAYDLVFMDLLMPQMNGLEATREIRLRQKDAAHHPSYASPIGIVAMTACAMPGDREKCFAAGMDDYLAKPVRLEDMRAVIERWGNSPVSSGTTSAAEAEAAPAVASAPAAAAAPPADLARLRELTDGTEAGFQELVELYLEQTTTQMEQLADAVRGGNAGDVRRIAHSCAGASASCGITGLVPLLRKLEQQGGEGKLTNANELYAAAMEEFARLRVFLASHARPAAELVAQD